MEPKDLYLIIRRWAWLILVVMLVTLGTTAYRVRMNPTYESRVTLELTAPQEEDVTLFNQYRSITLRDEMAAARNNLTEVLKSEVVHDRTVAQLGLRGSSAIYDLSVNPSRDADFTYVVVNAASPDL